MANWELYRNRITLQGETDKDRQTYSTKEAIETDFQNSLSYRDSYFNGSTTITGIQIIDTDDLNKKQILMYPETALNVGDNINFDNQDWICIEVNKTNLIYESGVVQKCTHTLLVNKNAILTEVPCIVSNSTMVETTEGIKYFPLEEGKIEAIVSNNDDTQSIDINQTYQIGRNKYKIYHINDTKNVGLLILSMKLTNENTTTITPAPTSAIIISGDDEIKKNTQQTYTSNMACTWSLTNEDGSANTYATIISQTDTTITIQGGTTLGENILLTATATSDNTTTITKTIEIVGLF